MPPLLHSTQGSVVAVTPTFNPPLQGRADCGGERAVEHISLRAPAGVGVRKHASKLKHTDTLRAATRTRASGTA
jgi:hypothetical protein